MEHQAAIKTNQHDQQSQTSCCANSNSSAPESIHVIRDLHRRIGNQALGSHLQTKLKISEPHDTHEQEADRVANAVMAGNSVPIGHVSQGIQPKLYRVEARPEDVVDSMSPMEGEFNFETPETGATEEVQRKASGEAGVVARDFDRSLDQATQSGGEALPHPTRSFMEGRLGWDLSAVRVHSDARADTLARAVNARAFTLDRDIFFARSEYRPDSTEGQHLLAHELTHVVQQSARGISRQIQRSTSCSSYPGHDTGVALDIYNCAGLALRTYQNTAPPSAVYSSIMANFTQPETPIGTSCAPGAIKFWLWEYHMRLEDDLGNIIQQRDRRGNVFTTWRDFHIVAGLTDSSGADPTDVLSKNGFRRVHGPGTGPSFQPAARERSLSNDASEAPVTINGRPAFKVRTNMTEHVSCAGCHP